MTDSLNPHVYRVDKFVVPASARDAFFARASAAKDVLKHLEGFVCSTYLEQFAGPGEFNVVTIAEWESQSHIEHAKGVMAALVESEGIEPQEQFQRRLGIKADLGFFREV